MARKPPASSKSDAPLEALRECPECGAEGVVTRGDLVWEETTPGPLLVVAGLRGATCRSCGEKWFDAPSLALIQQHRRSVSKANYEIKVAKVGGNTIGMYFPKDLARVMDLEPGLKGFATPISESTFIVELRREPVPPSKSRSRLKQIDDALGI